jgi:hypothetical protein
MAVHSDQLDQFELESLLLVREIVGLKKQIRDVLLKYGVKRLDEIEDLISNGTIPEHPSYEEYLAALSIQQTISDLKVRTKILIEDL